MTLLKAGIQAAVDVANAHPRVTFFVLGIFAGMLIEKVNYGVIRTREVNRGEK